jgi:hypothetical protein
MRIMYTLYLALSAMWLLINSEHLEGGWAICNLVRIMVSRLSQETVDYRTILWHSFLFQVFLLLYVFTMATIVFYLNNVKIIQ